MAQWFFNSAQNDLDAGFLIWVVAFQVFDVSTCTQQGNAAARNNAFFYSSTGSVQCIFNACFFLFHFNFSCSANLDHSNTACQFGNALLQFFTVVVGSCFFDLNTRICLTRASIE